MEIKLELRKEKEDGIFYRYKIGDFRFWFVQHTDGNIYAVYIAYIADAGKRYEDFELFIHANEENGCWYPNNFVLKGSSASMTTKEAKIYMERMTEVCAILDEVQNFFKTSFHANVGNLS